MRTVRRLAVAGALLVAALATGIPGGAGAQPLWAGVERPDDQTATEAAQDTDGKGDATGTAGDDGRSGSVSEDATTTPESGLLPAASADLDATMTGWWGSQVGQPLTYVVVVTNTGPSRASGVRLTIAFSRGGVPEWSQTSRGSCAVEGSTLVCDIGDLSVSAAARVTTQITSNDVMFIGGTASVVGNESDPNPANNRASITLQRSGPTIHLDPPGTPV